MIRFSLMLTLKTVIVKGLIRPNESTLNEIAVVVLLTTPDSENTNKVLALRAKALAKESLPTIF
ncbi:MAG TPA: hypothetical protein VG737_16170 [Cyclobacteriaceae bacterium]|nr:hypothetical protein [Cyclobacteriaceae bacterium]